MRTTEELEFTELHFYTQLLADMQPFTSSLLGCAQKCAPSAISRKIQHLDSASPAYRVAGESLVEKWIFKN